VYYFIKNSKNLIYNLFGGRDPSNFHYQNQKEQNVGGKERIIFNGPQIEPSG
jgi:hypothetical protein